MSPSAEIGTVNVKVVATLLSPKEFEQKLSDLLWINTEIDSDAAEALAALIVAEINVVQVANQ